MRRRMVWFYRAKTEKQAEEKPKPVSYFFEPTIHDFFNGAPEDGTPIYFDKEIIAGLQNIPLKIVVETLLKIPLMTCITDWHLNSPA